MGGTTAGTVILARLANKYWDWNISYALLFFDLIVAGLSVFVIGIEKVMFTVVILYIGTKAMEFIIEGLNPKRPLPSSRLIMTASRFGLRRLWTAG